MTHTPSSVFGSLPSTRTHIHTHSLTLSRALMLTWLETDSFLKVPARLALPGTVDAVSHVNLELETDVELCSQVTLVASAI